MLPAVREDPHPAVGPQQGRLPLQPAHEGHQPPKAGAAEAAAEKEHPGQHLVRHGGPEVSQDAEKHLLTLCLKHSAKKNFLHLHCHSNLVQDGTNTLLVSHLVKCVVHEVVLEK